MMFNITFLISYASRDQCAMMTDPNYLLRRRQHCYKGSIVLGFGMIVVLFVLPIPSANALKGHKKEGHFRETSNIFLFPDEGQFISKNAKKNTKKGKRSKNRIKTANFVQPNQDINANISDSNSVSDAKVSSEEITLTLFTPECDDGPKCSTTISNSTNSELPKTTSIDCDDGPDCPSHSPSPRQTRNKTVTAVNLLNYDPDCDDGPDCPTSSQGFWGYGNLTVDDKQSISISIVSIGADGESDKEESQVTVAVKEKSTSTGWTAASLLALYIVFASMIIT
jgi:hypothetical protein